MLQPMVLSRFILAIVKPPIDYLCPLFLMLTSSKTTITASDLADLFHEEPRHLSFCTKPLVSLCFGAHPTLLMEVNWAKRPHLIISGVEFQVVRMSSQFVYVVGFVARETLP